MINKDSICQGPSTVATKILPSTVVTKKQTKPTVGRFLGKLSIQGQGARNIRDEPGTFCSARTEGNAQKQNKQTKRKALQEHVKGTQGQVKELWMAKTGTI